MADEKEKTNVPGHTGILSIWKTAAYKPIVCLISTSMSRAAVLVEKVNYCTQGKTKSKITDIDKTISFEAEVVTLEADDTSAAIYSDVAEAMETKEDQYFKLEGRGGPMYFKGIISSLDDTFPAEGDATFSGELTINESYDTDPKSGG